MASDFTREYNEGDQFAGDSGVSVSPIDTSAIHSKAGRRSTDRIPKNNDSQKEGSEQQDSSPNQNSITPERYDQQMVVNRYANHLKPIPSDMAHQLKTLGVPELEQRVLLIIGILNEVNGQPDLAFPLFVETESLQSELLMQRELDPNPNGERSGGGSATSNTPTADAAPAASRKSAWDRLARTFEEKVGPDTWRLIAHLRVVKEWTASGEVSANAFFVKGKMGISIKFGE
jgi:hypothetical protein